MPRLCAFGCQSIGVPLHRFPKFKRFPDRFRTWVTLVGGKLETQSDYEYYEKKRVCDIHFTDKDRTRYHRISACAIPSLYLPGSSETEVLMEQLPLHLQQATRSPPVQGSSATELLMEQPPSDLQQATRSPAVQVASTVTPTIGNLLLEHSYFITNKKNIARKGANKLKGAFAKIKQFQTNISRLRKRQLVFKERLRNAENLSSSAAFLHNVRNMKKPSQLFVHMQLQTTKKAKGRRFSLEEKVLALSLFKKSPKCYRLLNNYFTLPSSKTMKRLLSKIKITPGINKIIFGKIADSIMHLPTSDKLCSLIFDEMSLTPQIFYNIHADKLEGFCTNDESKFADHVLVFMIKGIKQNFKQPIAYYFTTGLKRTELKNLIKTVIKEAQDSGLTIINTVCDQSTVNVGAITDLVEDTKRKYFRRGLEWHHDLFRVNRQNIVPIYDVPHLIKGLRNNLLTKDMVYTINKVEKIVKWDYYQKLYAADQSYGELRLLYKLTEEHINPDKITKMRVKTATQIFSHSVAVATEHLTARGDLPIECKNLIDITIMLDQLFDSLNVSTYYVPNGKEFKGPIKKNSPHHKLWVNCKKVLKSIKFKNLRNVGNKIRVTESTVPSVQNFIKTIEGIEAIWRILNTKYGFETFLTRNLNQDPVENFFGNIRSYGARNVAPNTLGFEGAFKSLLLNNYNSPHSHRANCEQDLNKCLHTLEFFLTEKPSEHSSDVVKDTNVVVNFNMDMLTISNECDAGQRNYVCGWVLKKCLKNIVKSCQICKQNLLDQHNKNVNNAYIKMKEYDNKKWLCYPSKELELCFNDLQNITVCHLKNHGQKKDIKKNILAVADVLVDYPFKCDQHNSLFF